MDVYHLTFADKFISPVLDNGVSKVVQFSFEKGKVLQKHITSSDILVTVLSGQIHFKTEGKEVMLQAGDLLSLEKEVEHSLEAMEKSIVLVTLTPSPSAHSIFKPIAGQGKFIPTKTNGSL